MTTLKSRDEATELKMLTMQIEFLRSTCLTLQSNYTLLANRVVATELEILRLQSTSVTHSAATGNIKINRNANGTWSISSQP